MGGPRARDPQAGRGPESGLPVRETHSPHLPAVPTSSAFAAALQRPHGQAPRPGHGRAAPPAAAASGEKLVSGLKVATGPGPKFGPRAVDPAPSPDPGPPRPSPPAAGRTCDEVGVGRRRGRGGDGAVAVRAAREVALAGLQVVGGRPLLQQGLVVHGGRRPPRPARLPPGLSQRLPLPRWLGLARTPGPGGGTRSSGAAAAAAGLGPSRRRAPRASPPRLPPGQSQDPGHVARLPAGVRRGAGPERRLKGAAPAPGHPVGHLSALTSRSSPPPLHGPETAARGETPRHKHECKGDFALGSQPLWPVDSAPSSAWARSTHLRVKTPLAG